MKSTRPYGQGSNRRPVIHRPNQRRRNPPLGLVITVDILLIGLGLIIFALFHHVLPRDIQTSGIVLPTAVATTTAATTSDTLPSDSTEATPAATTETTAATTTETERGAWGAKFKDKFTDGEIEKTAATYKSENINITVTKVQASDITYYVADIYLRDLQYFRTAFAGGNYAHGITAEVLDMAAENNAILAISGDYYGVRSSGVVIRNGQLYREKLYDDVLLMNNDGSLETWTRDQFDIGPVKANGAWQAWSFGPMLLDGGQPMTSFNSNVTPKNPRAAIGYYEPGHYCFVLVDGRQPGYSVGMSMTELSRLFYELGCSVAYNLDGGESAVMVFLDAWASQPYHDGRKVSDIVYIGE